MPLDAPVQLYMSAPVYAIPPDASLSDARSRLDEWRISAIAVVASGELLGVVSRTDLLRIGRSEAREDGRGVVLILPEKPVSEVMSTNLITISAAETMTAAAKAMVQASVHRVFVMGASGLVGVLSTRNVMDALAAKRPQAQLSDFMTAPITAVRAEEPLATAVERMENAGVSGLVVLDQGWPVGVFTQQEALIARNLPDGISVDWALNPAMLALPYDTPIYRAAASAASMDVRRVIVTRDKLVAGIVTGLDFCRAAVELSESANS